MEAVVIERELRGGRQSSRACARDHRPAKQRCGLALDHAKIVFAIRLDATAALQLQRFGEDHLVDHREHSIEQAIDIGRADSLQRRDEQPVAREDRCGISVDHRRGRLAAASFGNVDHVVVEQRRGVDQLDGDREPACPRREPGAESARERDATRPQVLASEIDEVMCRGVNDARAARQRRELRLELDEIGANPTIERLEARTEDGRAARGADVREAAHDCVAGLNHVFLRCFRMFQRFLKSPV